MLAYPLLLDGHHGEGLGSSQKGKEDSELHGASFLLGCYKICGFNTRVVIMTTSLLVEKCQRAGIKALSTRSIERGRCSSAGTISPAADGIHSKKIRECLGGVLIVAAFVTIAVAFRRTNSCANLIHGRTLILRAQHTVDGRTAQKTMLDKKTMRR